MFLLFFRRLDRLFFHFTLFLFIDNFWFPFDFCPIFPGDAGGIASRWWQIVVGGEDKVHLKNTTNSFCYKTAEITNPFFNSRILDDVQMDRRTLSRILICELVNLRKKDAEF